ncbi:MAG: hypothetical protein Tsb0014_45710 [Pleurocapsa sp.]
MNQYFQVFQEMLHDIEALQNEEDNFLNSQEIKRSAQNLNKLIHPCIKEIKQSSSNLNKLIDSNLIELDKAQDIWESKERIINMPQSEIWQQLAILTGLHIKIKQLGDRNKKETLQKAEKIWHQKIEILRKTFFTNGKGQMKYKIGLMDKWGFERDIAIQIKFYQQALCFFLNSKIQQLFQSLDSIDEKLLKFNFKRLDRSSKSKYYLKYKQYKKITQNLKNSLISVDELEIVNIKQFQQHSKSTMETWKNRLGEITWQEVIVFQRQALKIMSDNIEKIFDRQITLIQNILNETIGFYHELLEKQTRYQQETVEQRLAEQAWLQKQRKMLQQLKVDIQTIIS